ncbi:hypothetical protein DFO62_1296 [Serratia fonticola]|nr:hypothetical protein DFO62_1296 [Serratia fonticola]
MAPYYCDTGSRDDLSLRDNSEFSGSAITIKNGVKPDVYQMD